MSDVDNKVKMIVEGLLLAAGRPLTLDNIIQVFSDDEKPDRQELKAVMESIAEDCNDRGFELKEVASGFRFQVKQDLSEWVAKLWEERPPRYTRALLETLALIAYRQPITRGDIEEIRGVAVSSNIIRTLLDREWVRVVGHRDVPGRPAMFATTKQFLDYFNLKSLQDLPPLSEIKDLDKIGREASLNDDLQNSRVLELPEEAIDENAFETSLMDPDELLEVEEAIELSKKPLDEILNAGMETVDDEDESATASDEELDSDPTSDASDAAEFDTGGEQESDLVEDMDQSSDWLPSDEPEFVIESDVLEQSADDADEHDANPDDYDSDPDNDDSDDSQPDKTRNADAAVLEFSTDDDTDELDRD